MAEGRWADSQRFEDLVRRAEDLVETAPVDACHLVEEALTLWRGPSFEAYDLDGFAPGLVARLSECRIIHPSDFGPTT